MKCAEAIESLRPTQAEFSRRYFLWCVEQIATEQDAGFLHLRRFPSSQTFAFLDFVATLTVSEVRAAMTANVKFHQAEGVKLAGAVMLPEEARMRERWLAFLQPEVALHGQSATTLYVSPREKELKRSDLEGAARLWERMDRNTFKAILRKQFDPLFGSPERGKSVGLDYRVAVGSWYLCTSIDLTGRSQLAYAQRIEARLTRDLFPCTLTPGHGISLLGWCGIHPSTKTDLIEASRLDEIAVLLREVCEHVLSEAPRLLAGLDHAIAEAIEDANTWLDARLAQGLAGLHAPGKSTRDTP